MPPQQGAFEGRRAIRNEQLVNPALVDRAARVLIAYNKAVQEKAAYVSEDTLNPLDIVRFAQSNLAFARQLEARQQEIKAESAQAEEREADERLFEQYAKYFPVYEFMIGDGQEEAAERRINIPDPSLLYELSQSLQDRSGRNNLAAWVEYAYKKTAPLREEQAAARAAALQKKQALEKQRQAQMNTNEERFRRLMIRTETANKGENWHSDIDEPSWPKRSTS